LATRMSGSIAARRETIARAACRAIVERGLHGVNMRDIARELGTTTGVLQHYFASKDELLVFTKNRVIDEMLDGARAAAAPLEGPQRLQAVCEGLLPMTKATRTAWLVLTAFNGRAIGDKALTSIQVSRYTKCRAFFEAEIDAAKEARILPNSIDTRLEAIALASFVDGLAVQVLFFRVREAAVIQRELVRRYLQRTFG
jgi:TetR/AcrR family transcriptional regulator, transcriptional repressor of bet genes